MTSTGCQVGFSWLRSPPLVSRHQEIHHLFWLIYWELCHAWEANSLDWVISQIKICVFWVWHQKVTDDLVVNLNVGDTDVVSFLRVLQDLLKHIFQNQVHYSWRLSVSCHRVSFARTCRSICKNTRIEPLEHRVNQMRASFFVNLLGCLLIVKNSIEVISLLPWSMENIWLFALVFTLHFNTVEYNLEMIFQN